MLTVGKKAPAFALPDQNGVTVALRDLAGSWVVLYFYPRDDTPGCTVEACEFTAALPDFRGLGARVFGCSADGQAAHTKFIGKHRLGIELLTDADRKVMTAYGAWGEKVMYGKKVEGVIRSTVLIAPDGTVAHHWAKVKAAGHAEHVRQRLAALRQGATGAAPSAPAGKRAAGAAGARRTGVGRGAGSGARKAAAPKVAARKSGARKGAKTAARPAARRPRSK